MTKARPARPPTWRTRLQAWRARRALLARARHVAKEARRLLRRKKSRLTPDVVTALHADLERLVGRLKERPRDVDAIETAALALDRGLDQHLKWARKSVTREYIEGILWAVGVALLIRAFLFEAFEIPTGSMVPTLKVDDHLFVNKYLYGLRIPFTHTRFFEWRTAHRGEIVVFEYPGPGPDHGKDFIKRVIAVPGDRVRMRDNVVYVNDQALPTLRFVEGRAELGGKPVPGLLLPPWFGAVPCEDNGTQCRSDPRGCCRCVLQWERNGDYGYVTQHIDPFGPPCPYPHRNLADWPLEYKACPDPLDHSCEYWGHRTSPDEPWTGDVTIPPQSVFCMGDNRDRSHDGRYWKTVPFENIKGKAWIIWWADDLRRLFSLVHGG